MQPTPITVKGRNGTVRFDGTSVTITREGTLARLAQGRGDKWIPLGQITAVQFKPNGLRAGYVEFTIAGGNELHGRRSTASQRVRNENIVLFGKSVEPEMRRLVDTIRAAITNRS